MAQSKTSSKKKDQTPTRSIKTLESNLITKCKDLAQHKTSSAYDIVKATNELLRAESDLKEVSK